MGEPGLSPRARFLSGVNGLLRRARLDQVMRGTSAGLFFGLLPGLAVAVVAGSLPVTAGMALAGCAAGLAWALLHPVDRRRLLIHADAALDSRELASTALELADSAHPGVFGQAVLEDAASLLAANTPRAALGRPRLPLLPYAAAAVLLSAAALLFPVNLHDLFPGRSDRSAELAQIGEDLRGQGQKLAEASRAGDLGRSLALSQELAQLGRDLAENKIKQEDALDRMAELEAGLAQEYQLRLQEAQPSVPGKPGTGGAKSGGDDAQNPGKASPPGEGRQPGDAESGGNAESALGDALNRLRQAQRQLQGGAADGERAQSSTRQRKQRSQQQGQPGAQGLPPGQGDTSQSGQKGQDPGSDSPSGTGPGSPGQEAQTPGSGFGLTPAPEKRGAPSQIESGRGPGLQAQGNPAEGDSTRLLARALPQWTGSRLPEQTILNQYSRQAESALAKDEVPLKLKEYVKEYFTGIGIGK